MSKFITLRPAFEPLVLAVVAILAVTGGAALQAADYVQNGNFSSGTTGWTHTDVVGTTTMDTDAANFGAAAPSLRDVTGTGNRADFEWYDYQTISAPILSTDTVYLSFWWRKVAFVSTQTSSATVSVIIRKPSGATATVWSDGSNLTSPGVPSSGTVTDSLVSSAFDESGTYELRLYASVRTGRDNAAYIQVNWDDVVLDVRSPAANNAPQVTPGATAVSPATVNRLGTDSTVISTTFTDVDQPGIGAFTCTFRIRDGLAGELTLVNNQPNGGGGLTITDGGGGSYTASYTYNPDDAQTLDFYDLYFEVSDGTDSAIDPYASNDNELQIVEPPPNNAPTIVADTTAVSVTSINRIGSNATVLSSSFSDADIPGVGAFTCTFKIRDNVSTEYVLVDNQPNGAGGLTISNDGGGDYTATFSYDPGDTQTLGDYDLYFEVSDGIDNAIDGYTPNANELNIYQQVAPTVAAGATTASPTTVNRIGTDSTVISATFTDVDQPGVGAFTCTFRIRDGLLAELTLVNNLGDGAGGLTITDGGGGSYTASYTYNPDDAQPVDFYDLYFEVSDGTDNAIDGYGNNDNELQIQDLPPNAVPALTAGTTAASVSPVNRFSNNTTTLSATFSDADQPGIGAFNCTFKVRDTSGTEYTLVNNQPDGGGGLTILDNGGGSYTASYTYDPGAAQTLGLYDLYFSVTDGFDNAVDDYTNNLDELEINEVIPPTPPTVAAGATSVSVSPVNRLDANTTVISATFNDINQHPVTTFNCTFSIREPGDTTELILVDNQPHGSGGLTVTHNGGGSYTARYTYDPSDTQTLGFYDLYFSVTDGSTPAVDDYANNNNELQITEVVVNAAPQITASATQAVPSSIDRAGAGTTTISAVFSDSDDPGVAAFSVTFLLLRPYNQGVDTLASGLQNGQGGLTITSGGGGSYTASITWDPPANALVGYYDLYCQVSDGIAVATDNFADNPDELLIGNGGENARPIVASDALFASPGGVERIGANPTTLSATFTDGDIPAVSVFRASFKLREPDDATEVVLASFAADGQSGVTISDQGSGVYMASVAWDPADTDTLGFWDLYFAVTDGIDTAYDGYQNNLDELELYDAVSNNAPTIVADTTFVLPVSINRIGSEYTMLKSYFTDVDMPGPGAFTITFRVRDTGSTEYTIVNAAHHAEQGLRVVHRGGGTYEAAVLWDPDVADPTGLYDLYFQVTDNEGASATDGYTANADELTVTSSAVLGDGFLLHRTNDSAACGGPNSACHNLLDHQAQNCRVCHTPHATSNIYLIRDTIQTPSSGPMPVDFRTLGIGDPYNDPDPTPGVFAGVMADSTDNVFTGICEVCHVEPVGHHRNDGSQPGPNHHDAEDCTACHPHSAGFGVSGGGESSGGAACSCHNSIFNPMNTSTTSYHHLVNSNDADYTISSRTCLMCHVDHDIFRPDLNTGFGTRARNLRVDITTSVVQGSSAVLLNSDYQSTGTGGICLSCHTSQQTKGYTQPDGTTQTPVIAKAAYDAATTAHNYNATSTFSADGSTFNGNCVKCHNDSMSKSYQNSTHKFGVHDSAYRRILAALGIASPSDPLEEGLCLQCHSTGGDYYGVRTMSTSSQGIATAFTRTYTHPTSAFSGRHKPIEVAADLDSLNRHAECEDCHNPHAARQGTHDGSSSLASNALIGTWGVEPGSWPNPDTALPSNNANVFLAPTAYNRVEGATLTEWMICLKCHSNYTTLPSGARNLAEEINPNYPSTHGITIAHQNSYCNTTTMQEPWASSGLTYCSDCHRSDDPADPEGPHGSNAEHLLVATIVSNETDGTPLCFVCHSQTVYWSGSSAPSRYSQHPGTKTAHKKPKGCFACHMWDYAWQSGLGVQNSENLADGKIFVHGQNKYWNFKDDDGSAGTGNPADAFCNGYLADVDYAGFKCWSDEDATGCSHGHNGTNY